MEIYTMTKTALAPAFGMPALGSACAPVTRDRVLGWTDVHTAAPAAALQGTTVSIERVQDAFPGSSAWRPPIC